MSTKVLACLVAAAFVTVGGVAYYGGGSHCGGCPLSGLCPTATESGDATTCPVESAGCCPVLASAAPTTPACCEVSCCDGKADATAASFGGTVYAVKGLK